MNDFEQYYITQAGSGLSGFRGVKYQRGHGFFGRLLSGAVYPMLRFLGKNLLKTGANVASDLFESGDFTNANMKNIAMRNMKTGSKEAFEEAVDFLRNKMSGSGRKRRRSKISETSNTRKDKNLSIKSLNSIKVRKAKKGKSSNRRSKKNIVEGDLIF